MHDCLNLHGGFSGGFAFLRHAGSVCSQRVGGWGGFKTLCHLPSSHVLCNRCPDGPIYPTSSSCRGTEALGDVADLWPTTMTYKWDSCEKKSHTIFFVQCLCCWDLLPREWMGLMWPCSTKPLVAARWASGLFHCTGSIRRLKPRFLHQGFDFSVCLAEQEWDPQRKTSSAAQGGHVGSEQGPWPCPACWVKGASLLSSVDSEIIKCKSKEVK